MFDLRQRDLIASQVQLGRVRRFVRRDLLGMFQRSAVLEVCSYARRRGKLWQQVEKKPACLAHRFIMRRRSVTEAPPEQGPAN